MIVSEVEKIIGEVRSTFPVDFPPDLVNEWRELLRGAVGEETIKFILNDINLQCLSFCDGSARIR